jgi:hypothetical protein
MLAGGLRGEGEGAYIDVPDAAVNVVRPWPGAVLRGISSGQVVPLLRLEVPYSSGEETSGDQVEEAGGDDQEDLESG